MKKSHIIKIVAAVFILGVAIIIIASSIGLGAQEVKLDSIVKEDSRFLGKEIITEGKVVRGTVKPGSAPNDVSFAIGDDGGNQVRIHYQQILPDTFAEERSVVITGILVSPGQIEASNLAVKCPSKYQDMPVTPDNYEVYRKEHPSKK